MFQAPGPQAPSESEDHIAWREATTRARLWRADYAAQLGRSLASLTGDLFEPRVEGDQRKRLEVAHENAKTFADECEKMREGWAREDSDIIEPPYVSLPEGELPGHIPGNPNDGFAGRAPFNPHT